MKHERPQLRVIEGGKRNFGFPRRPAPEPKDPHLLGIAAISITLLALLIWAVATVAVWP